MMLSTGQLLADRYRLTQRIAVGGMGEVWSAEDTRLDRTVAMKILKAELSGDAEFLHRFRTEARTTASLNHQGVAAVHDYGETASSPEGGEDTAYLVMELVEGEPMATLLARHGRLSVEFTLDVLEQSAQALQAAHERGLVHRDVKPGNIMITQRPNGEVSVKLTDFGIAKAAHAAPVTRSGMVMGTAHYIAPEQATGSEATTASDVYSLATCGYECLAGRRPFLSDHAVTVAMQHIREVPPPLPPDIAAPVRQLIDFGMAKDPRQRYSSGGEFAAAVATVRSGGPPPSGYQAGTPSSSSVPSATPPVPTYPVSPNPISAPHALTPAHGIPPGAPYPPTGAAYAQPHRHRGPRPWVWVLLIVVVVAVVAVTVLLVTRAVASRSTQTAAGPVATTADARPGGRTASQEPVPRGGRSGTTRVASQFGDSDVTSIPPDEYVRSGAHATVLDTPGVGGEDHH